MPLQLLSLPSEIISHILSFLDSTPPSFAKLEEYPTRPTVDHDPRRPLKTASLLDRCLRNLALPILFRHIYVLPETLNNTIAFATSTVLAIQPTTAHIFLSTPTTHQHPPWWSVLLKHFPTLHTLTITAPPHIFAEITGQSLILKDSWAFKIPYQTLQLSHLATTTSTTPTQPTTSLLTARPWTSLHLNASSFLPAYTTYEYFLRTPPSPLLSPLTLSPTSHLHTLLANLTHLTYTAIFPFYNHLNTLLNHLQSCTPNLQTLTLRLLPTPHSTVLSDALEAAGNHFDVNDPWSEWETGVVLVGNFAVRKAAEEAVGVGRGRFRELIMRDVEMEGVRGTLEEALEEVFRERAELRWEYKGNGRWVREVDPADTVVVSLAT